ncbi:GNAT family N-acetyltransferase [Kitasatospora purpeofusca]|uniref:GNAT family N-acetyltransferase n=1 Tax=Kitasatospora purpeofusca TaxID=67352 RepID=UPI002E15A80B|nr:GNAT family N-acetyltransferase [Kitasatospora purpeofusca]
MTDSENTPGTEDGIETADREVCWRGRDIGFAVVDVDDAELLQRWRSDPVAVHQIGYWPRALSALRDRLERQRNDNERDDFLVLLPDGTPIGHISLFDQDLADGTAEISLLLDERHQGGGHGPAALDALVDLAFGELPLHRLQAVTHTGNAPALAVLAGAGFVQEGVRRSACLHRGTRYDAAVLSLLRPEWEALTRPRSWDL